MELNLAKLLSINKKQNISQSVIAVETVVEETEIPNKTDNIVTIENKEITLDLTDKIIYKEINTELLTPFPNQPFKAYTGERLESLANSIKENGVVTPIVVRKLDENVYQIISGHNRVNACKKLNITFLPSIVKNLDDDTARIEMIEANLNNRKDLLPSEKLLHIK